MLFSSLLSVIAPHDCLGCAAEGYLLCPACRPLLRPAVHRCFMCLRSDEGSRTCSACRRRTSLSAVHAAVRYEGLAKELVWKLKFGRARAAAHEIGDILASAVGGYDADRVIVTHIPTASNRVRQRGYDQAARIARAYAGKLELRHAPLLGRVGHQKQVGASRAVRKSQLEEAFRPLRPHRIKGAHIILIDDVVTTGATLQTAAKVLHDAGAKRVEAVIFAQA